MDCLDWFPATEEYFYIQKQKRGNDLLRSYCKTCDRIRANQYRLKHKEERALYHKQWIKKDDNREIVNDRAKKWRKNNKEWKQEYQLQYQRENPDKYKIYNEQHRIHKVTTKEWDDCLKYFNYSCAYCGMSQEDAKEKYNNYLHKEHVVHDGSNDLSNCVPACKSCNSRKRTMTLYNWYNEYNPRYSEERLVKISKWLNKDYNQYIETKI